VGLSHVPSCQSFLVWLCDFDCVEPIAAKPVILLCFRVNDIEPAAKSAFGNDLKSFIPARDAHNGGGIIQVSL